MPFCSFDTWRIDFRGTVELWWNIYSPELHSIHLVSVQNIDHHKLLGCFVHPSFTQLLQLVNADKKYLCLRWKCYRVYPKFVASVFQRVNSLDTFWVKTSQELENLNDKKDIEAITNYLNEFWSSSTYVEMRKIYTCYFNLKLFYFLIIILTIIIS